MLNSPMSLLSSLAGEVSGHPSFVQRTFGEPLFHTESSIIALAYADDDTLWTIEEAGVLRHWATNGHLIERFFLSDLEDVWVFSPNLQWLVSGANELATWSTTEGEELSRIAVDSWITVAAVSPDNKAVATGHDDGTIRFWALPGLEQISRIDGHHLAVSALAWSPCGDRITSAGDDHVIRDFEVTGGTLIRERRGHSDRIPGLAWQPTGGFLVSVGWDTTARVWEPESTDPSMLLNAHSDQVNAMAFSGDGAMLACADSDFVIHVWADPRQGKARHILRGHTDEIRSLAFNKSGTRLASAGSDRVVHVWDVEAGRLVAGLNPNARHQVTISGNTIFSPAASVVQAWNTDTGERLGVFDCQESVLGLAASPNGKLLAATGPSMDVRLWDVENRCSSAVLSHTRGPIGSPTFSPDSTMLATASRSDGLVWLWKIGETEAMLVIPEAADNSTLETIAFHPGGRYLAVGGLDWLSTSGEDGALCIWDLETRDKFATLSAGVTAAAFDALGKYLAAGTWSQKGQSVVVWDFEKQEKLFDLPGHHDRINAVVFSPDGSWLVSASDDCTVRVWNVLTGRLAVSRHFDTAVQSLAFSADGRHLFTGNANATSFRLEMKRLIED